MKNRPRRKTGKGRAQYERHGKKYVGRGIELRKLWRGREPFRGGSKEAKEFGRLAEKDAEKILVDLGFKEIDYIVPFRNQFFFDFIAWKNDSLFLIDVTTAKTKNIVVENCRIAADLYANYRILHISPLRKIFWLSKVVDPISSNVPVDVVLEKTKLEKYGEYQGLVEESRFELSSAKTYTW